MCKQLVPRGIYVVPGGVNSDVVENVFCQLRGRNGNKDNPRYVDVGPTMNGVILGQSNCSRKSNTGYVKVMNST